MSDVFDVTGFDELLETIDRFVSSEFIEAARVGMTKAMLYLHGKLPGYPSPPAAGEASKHWTDKQRRWFFWALSQGLVEGEYTRTGTLGRRFTTKVQVRGVEVLGEIGSDTPYAPWVVGPDENEAITIGGVQMFQAPIHRGRWWQFQEVVDANLGEAYSIFAEAFFEEIEKAYIAA